MLALAEGNPVASGLANAAANQHPARVYRVLAVDDDALSLTLISRLLEHMGHVVRKATGGQEALDIIDAGWPDIVLTDLHMPDVDGCAVARHAKSASRSWLPVIMLTASSHGDDSLVKALQAGADDHLVKPVSFPVLGAKLTALSRTLELQRETERQHEQLKSYRAVEEENTRMAEHLLSQLNERAGVSDPALAHWVRAADRFSGDMVIAARTPGGALHVMLADATGHGLPAAISLLPVLKTFQAMTIKGYGVGEIARELNNATRAHLPVGRFIAATLVAVDARYRRVQVWNGSNPPLYVITEDGEILFCASSRHLALGIADERLFSAAVEQFEYHRPCQAVACSDGVLEVSTRSGPPMGSTGWLSLLRAHGPQQRMQALRHALEVPMPLGGHEDDVSVVMVSCALTAAAVALARPPEDPAARQTPGQWRATLTLSERELKRLDPVPMLLGFINQMDGIKPHAGNLFLILSELFNNALDHGLLGLDSTIKQGEGGFERWELTRAARLKELESGTIELRMKVRLEGARQMLVIVLKDSGPGFDLAKLDAVHCGVQPHGRGVRLVRQLCQSVEYRGSGNDVKALYDLGEIGLR
jgi:CheY-like chemotaxis protein